MNKPTYTTVVVAITIIAVLTLQGAWHQMHPPTGSRAQHTIQTPLNSDDAAEAREAARDFFTAMQDSDWDALAKFWPGGAGKKFDAIFTPQNKDLVSGLEIVSIGTPYHESGNVWTMIPYEVQFKGGGSQTNSLRMEKQRDGRWTWGGGF
jgi:hypothetical protein